MTNQSSNRLLNYLPGIFHRKPAKDEKPEGYFWLGEYLLPFEEVLDEFDRYLQRRDQYFAPDYSPVDDFLPWLAQWVALPFAQSMAAFTSPITRSDPIASFVRLGPRKFGCRKIHPCC